MHCIAILPKSGRCAFLARELLKDWGGDETSCSKRISFIHGGQSRHAYSTRPFTSFLLLFLVYFDTRPPGYLLLLIIIILVITTGNNGGITFYYVFYLISSILHHLSGRYALSCMRDAVFKKGIGKKEEKGSHIPSSSVLGFASSSSSSSSSSSPGFKPAASHADF